MTVYAAKRSSKVGDVASAMLAGLSAAQTQLLHAAGCACLFPAMRLKVMESLAMGQRFAHIGPRL
jgi:hypothetical protein